jgi:DNA-binding response OmpR family regulator
MVRKVLSVCHERCLPRSTLDFLERSDCHITCARAVGAALEFFNAVTFDLILINQTVSSPQEHLFVKIVREKSAVPIVFVSEDVAAKPTGVDAWLKPPITVEELLRVISDLVGGRPVFEAAWVEKCRAPASIPFPCPCRPPR